MKIKKISQSQQKTAARRFFRRPKIPGFMPLAFSDQVTALFVPRRGFKAGDFGFTVPCFGHRGSSEGFGFQGSRIRILTQFTSYCPEGGSAELPSGRWVEGITPGKMARPPTDFPDGGSAELPSGRRLGKITFGKAVCRNYSWKGCSSQLLSGRWLGRITFRKVVQANYSPEGSSAELPSGRWLGGITPGKWLGQIVFQKVARPNYVPSGR
jgi:hypothetical protein